MRRALKMQSANRALLARQGLAYLRHTRPEAKGGELLLAKDAAKKATLVSQGQAVDHKKVSNRR
jgi:hypothetical protein